MKNVFKQVFIYIFLPITLALGQNQTPTLTTVLSEDLLPFTIEIDTATFALPTGLQSYASAIYKGQWILLAGRTNGLHGFDNVGNNFPPNFQNTTVYVINPRFGTSISRTLVNSGLAQDVIDTLSVTASESFQKDRTLYVVGGYGINTATGQMETKSTLTALDLKKVIEWVEGNRSSLSDAVRQTSNPLLQVTGGALFQNSDHDPFLLILGQNFAGFYRGNSNGVYTQQIRSFWLKDNGKQLKIIPRISIAPLADYRRRDLNVVPIIHNDAPSYVALAGVFTLDTGVWTVPISITPRGKSNEPDPSAPYTFKQAMNQYNCAAFGLYSSKTNEMYVILPGGISYGFFQNGTFQTNAGIPFINNVTTIKIDPYYTFTQYIMNGQYPTILSTGTNPGNTLLFGAEAVFFPVDDISTYDNGVLKLDKIDSPTIIGYIAGGIMSTLGNTQTRADSTASPYVFTVKLIPR